MNKNDKLVVIFGVIILIVSSIGIYTFVPGNSQAKAAAVDEILTISGTMKNIPDSIITDDSSPFFPLIATPIAVNYNEKGEQSLIPLYITNFSKPSGAIEKLRNEQLQRYSIDEYIIESHENPKDVSLACAKQFWEQSKGALIMSQNKSGYLLGVIATPIASYLSIPIVVTDCIDGDVTKILQELGVTYTIICGSDLSGYGKTMRVTCVEDIIDLTTAILRNNYGSIDYLTLTNPIDAWPPESLKQEKFTFGPVTLPSTASTYLKQLLTQGGHRNIGSFTIPEDYKYALIKFEGVNLDYENVDEFGDSVGFSIGADLPDIPGGLQQWEVYVGGTGGGGVADRDSNGQLIKDKVYIETVLYDRGGVTYNVEANGVWLLKSQGKVIANVIVEKLENPTYPLMNGLSSIAPYLTASHKGLIFGKPDFAFTADDDVLTDRGQTCPGYYVPRRNPELTPMLNDHIFDKIHIPLNEILASLADVNLDKEANLEFLRTYYQENPMYIALVGGATVLPNFIYQNHVEPVDVENTQYYFGGGTPSDVIYGNIDPIYYDWSNLANDVYTEYPYVENIVGRITGWDAQDASALVTRNLFYNEIILNLDEWKDTFGLLMGGGNDFQKPFIKYRIFGDLLGMVPHGEPMKYPTGYSEISGQRTLDQISEPLGFTAREAWVDAAMVKGFSDEAIHQIKSETTLLSKLFFRESQVKRLAGEGNVVGGDIMESSNFIWANAHGCQNLFGMSGIELTSAGLGGPILHEILTRTLPIVRGGFIGPGSHLGQVGMYNTRNVANMDFGPSFMWLESCICGKIDGVYPTSGVGQAILHSGVASLIASPTGSNIAGGYLEPKNRMYDNPFSVWNAQRKTEQDAKQEIYPDPHFGFLLYTYLCNDLKDNDVSIGLAFRNAKNDYLPKDADWELWWAPPLISTGNAVWDSILNTEVKESTASGPGPMLEAKYVSFQEYMLFGDPALNLYEPINQG